MKIKQKQSKKTFYILLLCAVLLLLVAGGFYYLRQRTAQTTTPSVAPEAKDTANNSESQNQQQKVDAKSSSTNTNVDSSKTVDQVPTSDSISVQITNLSANSSEVTYSAAISGSTGGTCSATFTNPNGKPVIRNTPANGATCGPVSIPSLEFDALGEWTLTLRYYDNNTQATATKTVLVN